jgi:CubicO group peptidase (beta-lactamase class C family)
MKLLNPFLLIIAGLSMVSCVENTDSNAVNPVSAKMSPERLNRIDTLLLESISKEWIKGAVAYIARDGKIAYYRSFGVNDVDNKSELNKDAIFRIASQTKAITSVAVMMLFEEGKYLLDDRVSAYIPEFANPTVIATFNEKDTTWTSIPANRDITIRDLLTHTSGIDYAGIDRRQGRGPDRREGVVMGERPRPDIDHTREALREHDERVSEDPAEPEEAEEASKGEDSNDD